MEQKINKLFIQILTKKGKKFIYEKLFYNLLVFLKKKTKQNPTFLFIKALKSLISKLKIINVLIKKKKFTKKKQKNRIILLKPENQIKMGIHWFFDQILKKKSIPSLAKNIIEINEGKSKSLVLKKKFYKQIKKFIYNYTI